ncbi:MAG: hypothetical protein ACF8PN_00020 [Phycisphaerales bacterium]
MNPDQPLRLIPTCAHLRHKMMYCDDRQMTPGEVDDQSTTRVFWCRKTMEVIGPDNGPVDPDACGTGRACHEPARAPKKPKNETHFA